MRAATALLLVLAVVSAATAASTNIARVDDYIDAPRALFGRTLGEPSENSGRRRVGGPAATARSWRGRASRSHCLRPVASPA